MLSNSVRNYRSNLFHRTTSLILNFTLHTTMSLNTSISMLDISNVSDAYGDVARSSNLPLSSIELKPTKQNKAFKLLFNTFSDDELDFYFRELVYTISTRPKSTSKASLRKWQSDLTTVMAISAMNSPDIHFANLIGPTLSFRIAAFIKPIIRHAVPLPSAEFAEWFLGRLTVFSEGKVRLTPIGHDTAFNSGWNGGSPLTEFDDCYRSSFLCKVFDQAYHDFKISSSQSDSVLDQTSTSEFLGSVRQETTLSSTPCKLRKTRTPLKPRKSNSRRSIVPVQNMVAGPDLDCFVRRMNDELENSLIEIPISSLPVPPVAVNIQPPSPSKANFSTSLAVQTSGDDFQVPRSRTIATQTSFTLPTVIMRSVAIQCSFPEQTSCEAFVIYEDSISVGSFVGDNFDVVSKAELAGLPHSVDDDEYEFSSSFE